MRKPEYFQKTQDAMTHARATAADPRLAKNELTRAVYDTYVHKHGLEKVGSWELHLAFFNNRNKTKVVGEVASNIFGRSQAATIDYAHRLGLAMQLTNPFNNLL